MFIATCLSHKTCPQRISRDISFEEIPGITQEETEHVYP